MARVRDWALPRMIERGGAITAWIIDDTGFPKKGKHSIGVARQYCGQLGKQDNCQVAVSLSIANEGASLPVAWQLYLPEIWADDPERRKKAKIPGDIIFQTKPQIALEQIRAALATQTPVGVILADAGYGADGGFRRGLAELGLPYAVGCPADAQCLASRRRTTAAQGLERKGAAAVADAAKRGAQTSLRQGACGQSAGRCVADRHVARGQQCRSCVALCRCSSSCRVQRL
jgi:SRSO17 transposase